MGNSSNTMYGRDELAWGEAVDAVLPFLQATARNKGTTTYTDVNDVVKRHGLAGFDFHRAAERYAAGYLLRLVVLRDRSEEDWQPGEGLMISALVHYQGGSDPGPGFYALAQELNLLHEGRLTADEKMTFHIGQITAVQEHYNSVTIGLDIR
jgi:hypothetical protein